MAALLRTSFLVRYIPATFSKVADVNTPFHSSHPVLHPSRLHMFSYRRRTSLGCSFKCVSSNNENSQQLSKSFSVLETDIPWKSEDVWDIMGLFFFTMHIPLSFGGLSVVAAILHQPDLKPEIKALSLLMIQSLELLGAVCLLQSTTKTDSELLGFLFKSKKLPTERNWLVAVALGLLFLVVVIFLTSFLTDILFDTKDVSNPALKEILSSGLISETACGLVYCLVTPVLEEIVYRRFLLASLATSMKWHQAVIISSAVFSTAHLSGENFLQLFIVGAVLGCTYSWTGNLKSSIVLHSIYNALSLLVTYLS